MDTVKDRSTKPSTVKLAVVVIVVVVALAALLWLLFSSIPAMQHGPGMQHGLGLLGAHA